MYPLGVGVARFLEWGEDVVTRCGCCCWFQRAERGCSHSVWEVGPVTFVPLVVVVVVVVLPLPRLPLQILQAKS